MKIHFLKEEALAYFKGNIKSNMTQYLDSIYDWVQKKYTSYKNNNESAFGEFKIEIPEFSMDMSSNEKPESTDYNNVKILYSALKNVSDTQATDERLWAGLAHSDLSEYMIYRCKLNAENITEKKILTNFFFNYGNKRSLIVHPLARLWWVGRLLYDENKDNPYEALEYLKNDFSTKVLSLFSSNFTNNPSIVRAILNAISALESTGEKVDRKKFLELIRYVNLLGGIIILDYLSEEELKNKIIEHYYNLHGKRMIHDSNYFFIDKDGREKIFTDEHEFNEKKDTKEYKNFCCDDLDEYVATKILEINSETSAKEFFNSKSAAYSYEILGLPYPLIREFNPNLSVERQMQYKSRKGVFKEKIYEMQGKKFLIIEAKRFGLDKEKFDQWIEKIK